MLLLVQMISYGVLETRCGKDEWSTFYRTSKTEYPVIILQACFSTGWVDDNQVSNPIPTIYNFASMFTGSGANYYAQHIMGQV